MSGGSFQLHVMRNCGSLPKPCPPPPPPPPPPPLYHSNPPINRLSFSYPDYHLLGCVSYTCDVLSVLHFTLRCPIFNRPTIFHSFKPKPPPHRIPTKFLSLQGWDEGVLNLKSLVRKLTGTGRSRCCSHQAGHTSAQAGTPLVLLKGGRKRWGWLV